MESRGSMYPRAMLRRLPALAWSTFALGAMLGSLNGCREDFQCATGRESCECAQDGTCLEGLECRSDICVAPDAETSDSDAETDSSGGSEDTTEASGDGD